MQAIRGKVKDGNQKEIEFALPVRVVADALDISPEELIRAADEQKIGYRKITDQGDIVVVRVNAYARHCTVAVSAI